MTDPTPITSDSDYVCGWTTADSCPADALNSADEAVAQRAVTSAAEILYALSGRQFGLCEYTVRPCMKKCCDPCNLIGGGSVLSGWDTPWVPMLVGGLWYNISCWRCGDDCSCGKVCEIKLPGPVDSIIEVKIDGVVVDPTTYRVDNRKQLVRLGSDCWPTCQNMSVADTETNTFSVKYLKGRPVPEAGKVALTIFANEIAKALNCDTTCKIPARVTTVNRQGMSYTIMDPNNFIKEGKIGLTIPDLWLASMNPKARARRAGVFSPDMPQFRETTSP